MLWDIFCKVVDNYGDMGVCWRLSADLAARGQRVRLWVDDTSALTWMAPQGHAGVEVRAWTVPMDLRNTPQADVWLEAFGCDITPEFIANYRENTGAIVPKHRWVNLEYLTAEPYAERSHTLPSPVLSGPGTGLAKHFFYPGFTARTGGLLREPDLATRQAAFDAAAWLAQFGIARDGAAIFSLFCYEPARLDDWLNHLATRPQKTQLLVTHGRAAAAVQLWIWEQKARLPPSLLNSSLSISYLPPLSQIQFDELLWASDVNLVRGEDSLVRAIWAGKPFLWQIYPQHDDAHIAKLNAFLEATAAPPVVCRLMRDWNGAQDSAKPETNRIHTVTPSESAAWAAWAQQTRESLMRQPDLATQLLAFCS